jgi:hypothetical protein
VTRSNKAATSPLPHAPGDVSAPGLPRPTYLATNVPRESAGERQGFSGTWGRIVGGVRVLVLADVAPHASARLCGTLLQRRIVDLQLLHPVLHSHPRQRLQEGSGAETPPLPGPAGRTCSFPRCSRRKSDHSHVNASKEVTAPSGIAVDSAGCRRAVFFAPAV